PDPIELEAPFLERACLARILEADEFQAHSAEVSHPGDQMNGVVVVTGTKPRRSRIGRLSSDASTSRRRWPRSAARLARCATVALYIPRPRQSGSVAPPQSVAKSVPCSYRIQAAQTTAPSPSAT